MFGSFYACIDKSLLVKFADFGVKILKLLTCHTVQELVYAQLVGELEPLLAKDSLSLLTFQCYGATSMEAFTFDQVRCEGFS